MFQTSSFLKTSIRTAAVFLLFALSVSAQETRLLRQPTTSKQHIVFTYGSDLWIAAKDGGDARRLTSTPAVESNPHFSPDGKQIAFTSNRAGQEAVYVIPIDGGTPKRLTWYPAYARVRGWTPDGTKILYASSRETAPSNYDRLWTVPVNGGPSTLLPAPFATRGSFAVDGERIIIDRVRRWDGEWRGYRGGQNTPLTILDLDDLSEQQLPHDGSIDIQPLWLGETIYFLSDRDGIANIWSYAPQNKSIQQHTFYKSTDVKYINGQAETLCYEYNGYLYLLDPQSNENRKLSITVRGDFPWAETRWEDVSKNISSSALSPTGKRAIMQARGEIFTIPVEHGSPRNLTKSPHAADRRPLWSPKGDQVAWFSDVSGTGYELLIADQDGLSEPKHISIGESKLAWEPVWSPDGQYIAFVDDDVRIRVLNVEKEKIKTIGKGGANIERGSLGLTWSHDSKWLAYATTAANRFRRIHIWSVDDNKTHTVSNTLADAFAPAFDRDGKHLFFLAGTDLALGSGWANTSAMQADPEYGAYVMLLNKDDHTPFTLRSDEEKPDSTDAEKEKKEKKDEDKKKDDDKDSDKQETIHIDFDGIEQRTLALPMPVKSYTTTLSGPKGSVFILEDSDNGGDVLHKFTLEKREAKEFATGVSQISLSNDGKKMLFRKSGTWQVVETGGDKAGDEKKLNVKLHMHLDRPAEWQQMFEEAWRYQRDYFYDPDMHGRDWNAVHKRYAPLVPYVRHRADLNYILDQMNGELSVGHSFVFGGDHPDVEDSRVGVLGADLEIDDGYWKIKRIYTAESWNPKLNAPLAQPGLEVKRGDYLLGVNGEQLTAADDPYRLLDGTAGEQTVLHVSDKTDFADAKTVTVKPEKRENDLRQRTWVEDNRRRVDELSNGRLAYVWIPNTGGAGVVSFNRYFFAQQDKEGAVIDERFNGGGLLDDYMVDLMQRELRAAITNETPNGAPFRLPAGILGPKVLLINELAGSGGDFFPWVFRQQKIGPLIGMRTWGGLVKSSVHYALVDGGALTAPDNAVFDPAAGEWIGENKGIAPDIEVYPDAETTAQNRDPQLERAVQELMKKLPARKQKITPPAFSTLAK